MPCSIRNYPVLPRRLLGADGLALYHSVDSGASWTKLNSFAPVWNGRQDWFGPELAGASIVGGSCRGVLYNR